MKLNKALILIIIFTGLLSLETSNLNAQCQINSISPSTLSFAGYEGEVKYLTFGMSGGCSLSFSTPPFLQVIQTNSTQLKVTLVNRSTYPGAMTAGFGIMSNGTTLRSVPVNIGSGTTTQLSGGTISISQTTVGNNQSPGTFANSSSASGGSGNYGYQWHKSTNNGSTWSSITGATSLTYSCPALTQTTRFRRKVTSGTLTAYSNEITITVLGVCQITGANPSTLNMVGYSGESKIITLLGENLSVLYPITFGTPGFIQFERISDNQIKGTIVSDITYSAGGNIAIIITGDTNPPFLLPFSFAGVSTVKASSTENYILSYNPQVEVK
ncbi:MAG: hypothetical protein JXB00_18240, partial [Bacteroidales bacterium]|nr:hypothetical protein [Bacteroidales bacterium]